jgi:ketosteroid isomerase-like protein
MSTETAAVYAEDLREIEKLHDLDIAETLSGDQVALSTGWTDDIVVLEQGEEPGVGRQAILAARARRSAAMPGFRVVTYVPEIKNVTIADGWAFEWGLFTASFIQASGGQETPFRGKLLRVLKKQADGSWKVAIGMWNT